MTWTLKVDVDGDVRRVAVPGWQDAAPTYEMVLQTVAHLHNLSNREMQRLTLKYRDSESEMCTLAPRTLQDALSCASSSRLLRLVCFRAPARDPQEMEDSGHSMATEDGGSIADNSKTDAAKPDPTSLPPFTAPLENANLFDVLTASADGVTAETLAATLVEHLSFLVDSFPFWAAWLEQSATGNPVAAASIVQALREGLDLFPEMVMAQAALDSISKSDSDSIAPISPDAFSSALLTCLEAFQLLPSDEQIQAASILLAGIMSAFPASGLEGRGNCQQQHAQCGQERVEAPRGCTGGFELKSLGKGFGGTQARALINKAGGLLKSSGGHLADSALRTRLLRRLQRQL